MNWFTATFGETSHVSVTVRVPRAPVLIFIYGLLLVRIAGRRIFGKWGQVDRCRSSVAQSTAILGAPSGLIHHGRSIADSKNVGMSGHRQIGKHTHSSGPIVRHVKPARRRRCHHARSPDNGVGIVDGKLFALEKAMRMRRRIQVASSMRLRPGATSAHSSGRNRNGLRR
jgi:hypothetical protein